MKKIFKGETPILIIAMIVATSIVLIAYFINFHAYQFSNQTSDWGNFGSYVNGLLNPILLFLTIIYLSRSLKTQKDAVEKQKEDILTQLNLVTIANENQRHQIKELQKSNEIAQITNHQTELIKYINNAVTSFLEHNLNLDSDWDKISKKSHITDSEVKRLEYISKQKTNNFNKILNLNNLALNLILEDFDSVGELKQMFKGRWKDILEKFNNC